MLRRLFPVLPALLAAPLLANVPPEPIQSPPALVLPAGATATPMPLADYVRDPDVPGSAVRISVRIATTTHAIDVALFDAEAPETVDNFLDYVDAGRYAANFFHRSVPGFIIQSGGFRFINDTTFDQVPAYAPVVNEPGTSNTRGTLAMAKLGGDPNSATSQWFINLADNSANLDFQNGGFTVFARVLGNGMAVADQIAALPVYNTTGSPFFLPWNELPLSTNVLARANFIETSIARVAPLSHVAIAANPALLDVSVSAAGELQLTAKPGAAGFTTVRITSTDLEGGSLQTDLPVTVLGADPLVAWRQTHFTTTEGAGDAADGADPDGDGLPNFLEYAVGTSPRVPSAPATLAGLTGGHLTLRYARVADPALVYTVEVASAPAGPWSTLVAAGNPSTGAANVVGTVTVTDPEPLSEHPRRFLRLRVAR